MAQGDYTVANGNITSGTVTFQPSAGVSVVVKTCTAEYNSATEYISLENSAGYVMGYIQQPMRNNEHILGMLYFNCTIFMDNSSYLQFDGTASATKGYSFGYVQISE